MDRHDSGDLRFADLTNSPMPRGHERLMEAKESGKCDLLPGVPEDEVRVACATMVHAALSVRDSHGIEFDLTTAQRFMPGRLLAYAAEDPDPQKVNAARAMLRASTSGDWEFSQWSESTGGYVRRLIGVIRLMDDGRVVGAVADPGAPRDALGRALAEAIDSGMVSAKCDEADIRDFNDAPLTRGFAVILYRRSAEILSLIETLTLAVGMMLISLAIYTTLRERSPIPLLYWVGPLWMVVSVVRSMRGRLVAWRRVDFEHFGITPEEVDRAERESQEERK